jgi:hypothetical protein
VGRCENVHHESELLREGRRPCQLAGEVTTTGSGPVVRSHNILWWLARKDSNLRFLIQSLLPESGVASRVLSVRRASVGRRIGVSQMTTPK